MHSRVRFGAGGSYPEALKPEDATRLRIVMLSNNEIVMKEMERRAQRMSPLTDAEPGRVKVSLKGL